MRATALTTYENVPFEKGFGTIVTERVIDVIMLLSIILITFLLQTDVIMDMLQERGFNLNGLLILAGSVIILFILFVALIKKSKNAFAQKIKTFVKGLLDGVFSIFKMKHKWLFIFHTLFIWGCYIGMLSSALTIFGISTVSGDAFGWIIWIAQTLMIVVFGAISFILLPLLNRIK